MCLSLSLEWCWIITHFETTRASSDFVGAIFLTEDSH